MSNTRQNKFHSENSGLSLCPQKMGLAMNFPFLHDKIRQQIWGLCHPQASQSGQNASHQNSEHLTDGAQEDCPAVIPAPVATQEFYLMPVVMVNA